MALLLMCAPAVAPLRVFRRTHKRPVVAAVWHATQDCSETIAARTGVTPRVLACR